MPGKTTTETSADQVTLELDVLRAYSKDLLSRRNAIRDLGLRDYAGLLVALGDANLSMPPHSDQEIEEQSATFVKLLQRE